MATAAKVDFKDHAESAANDFALLRPKFDFLRRRFTESYQTLFSQQIEIARSTRLNSEPRALKVLG